MKFPIAALPFLFFMFAGTANSESSSNIFSDHIGWFNLQWPASAQISAGANFTVYVRCWQQDVTAVPGADPGIKVWIGYSTINSNPYTWTDWVPATFNTQYDQVDEYQAGFGAALPAGIYYYASRVQYNGGSYQFGGYNSGGGGLWDGTNNVSGILAVGKSLGRVTLNDTIRYHDGNPKQVTVITEPPGLPVLITYNGSSSAPTDTGNYTVEAVINHPGYQGKTKGELTIYTLSDDPSSTDLRKRLIWIMYDQVYNQTDMNNALLSGPDVVNRAWFKWGNWSGFSWNQWNWMAVQSNEKNALLGGGGTVMALYPDEMSTDKLLRLVERTCYNEPMHFMNNPAVNYYMGDFQNQEYLDFLLNWMYDQMDAGVNTFHLDGIAGVPALNTGYSDYSMNAFNSFLTEKYVLQKGWSVNDNRWESIFDISLEEDCTDGKISTFDFRKYLIRNGYADDPSSFNYPLKYEFGTSFYFKGTYSGKRNEDACRYLYKSIKNYATGLGKDVTVSTNGYSTWVDYQTTGVWSNWNVENGRLNVTPCYMNVWREIKSGSIRDHRKDLPLIVFHDWGDNMPFINEIPADDQILWLRIYAPEIFASGAVFAWPFAGGGKNFMTPAAVIDTMKNLIGWYKLNSDLYIESIWSDDQHVNLKGQSELVSSVLNQFDNAGNADRRIIHLINKKLNTDRTPTNRTDINIRVSSGAPVSVWAASPDFPDFRKLNFIINGDSIDIAVDYLEAYTVVVIDYKNKLPQRIYFNEIPEQQTGNPDYDPKAYSSSGLAITYTSENPSVATIAGGKIHITGPGTCDITASQPGNSEFSAASDQVRILTVGNSTPSGSVSDNKLKVYPNPFTDRIYVQAAEDLPVSVYDIMGKICFSGRTENGMLMVRGLLPGIYLVHVRESIFRMVKE